MKTKIEFITPKLAEKLLSRNCINRPVKKTTVDYYSDIIKRGQWELNGESIKISKEGILLDGQHRLMAIVKSGIGIKTVIVEGLDSSTFDTIDQGVARSTSDLFYVEGIKNSSKMSSIISRYYILSDSKQIGNSGANFKKLRLTKRDYINEYKNNEVLWDDICKNASQCYKKVKLITLSEIGGYMAFMIIIKKHNKENVYSFFRQLFFNENIENITIITLREKLINNAIGKYKLTGLCRHNLISTAWNCYIKGKELKRINVNDFDSYIELL